MVFCKRYGSITMGGIELRTGTSRFLVQGAFVLYKMVMAAYFIFWAIYWPTAGGLRTQAAKHLASWTWNVCTGYFIVSTVAALLCWRAMKHNDGPAATASTPISGRGVKNAWPFFLGGGTRKKPPVVQAPSPTTLSTRKATAASPRGSGSSLAQQKHGNNSPLPLGLGWVQLPLWNIACIAPFIVSLVWFRNDYVQQVQQDVTSFDIHAHGLMGFFTLVDQLLVADPFKLEHVVISQAYLVIFVVLSYFWSNWTPEEDKHLYEDILDWEGNAVQASIWTGVSVGILAPMAALVHFLVYRLREALHHRFQDRRAATLKLEALSIVSAQDSFHI